MIFPSVEGPVVKLGAELTPAADAWLVDEAAPVAAAVEAEPVALAPAMIEDAASGLMV